MSPKTIIFILLALVCYCCSPNVFKPTVADLENGKKKYAGLTQEELHAGFQLYSNKCGSCHTLYKPQELTEDRWAKVLPDMKVEAKLSDKEYDLICKYVNAKNSSVSNSGL